MRRSIVRGAHHGVYSCCVTALCAVVTACEEPPITGTDVRRVDASMDSGDSGRSTGDGTGVGDVPSDVPSGPPCMNDNECINDTRCVAGHCAPFGMGNSDSMCTRPSVRGPIRPGLQCVWSGPPMGDAHMTERAIMHTPLVANFGFTADADTPARPSIVFISDGGYRESVPNRGCEGNGTLRVIDGATCRDQAAANDPADRVNSPVTPAVGDLDGDGRPEIIAAHQEGGLIAFRVDPVARTLTRLWRSADRYGSNFCGWGGISLADLDDDGRPEILYDGAIYSSMGVQLATIPGWGRVTHGTMMIAANVDEDPAIEIADSQGTWEWRAGALVREAYDTRGVTPFGPRHTALAQMGDFGDAMGDPAGRPEIIGTENSRLSIVTMGGAVVRDVPAPGGAVGGGPPTVADFDGNGMPEIGVAFSNQYIVFRGDGTVLWSQPSQDTSSQRTGSSVFDFNADGRAEVVYGDECWVRVYDGPTGEILFSQARFSSTWHENPIVADVDADSSAEIVIPSSAPCQPGYCPDVDALFKGLRCDAASDCPGGTCDAGFCRCTMDADCGASYACMDPIAGTPGMGRVCRAVHRMCDIGLRVYRDARDRWAPARQIWNQHAYSVTNVNDNGTVPRSSMMMANWRTMGLNNFRQNTQGPPGPVPGADLTVGGLLADCEGDSTRLRATVCNRGLSFLDAGIEVIFRRMGMGMELCRLRTAAPIGPGRCTPVNCVANVQARGIFEAIVDPDEILLECKEGNNTARGEAMCGPG